MVNKIYYIILFSFLLAGTDGTIRGRVTDGKGEGLPGTDVGFWGGNAYPASEAMAGPNNVRMYGTWSMTNSSTGKSAKVKSYAVLSFNSDGKVHSVTEYGSFANIRSSFE